MNKQDLKIVFFGTPEFAVESLRLLHENGYNIVATVTMPDKPAGRGHHLYQSDVKRYAVEHGLPVLQPEKLKDENFVNALRALNADLFIVIAFRMLPEVVWTMPPLGTFNLHASLLPKYRGAAPINRAVMNGDTTTGVTTFFLKHEIDTGDIIAQKAIDISPTDNVGIVHDRLMLLGAQMTRETVDAIIAGTVQTISQDQLLNAGEKPTPAPKIFKDDCHINWNESATCVYNLIRGLSPYPAAWTQVIAPNGAKTDMKIFETSLPITKADTHPGHITTNGKTLFVDCADGALQILSLQLAGKKRMATDAFLRGYDITGCHFDND